MAPLGDSVSLVDGPSMTISSWPGTTFSTPETPVIGDSFPMTISSEL